MDTQQARSEADVIKTLLACSAVHHALSVLLRHPDTDTAKWLVAREHHRLPEVLGQFGDDGRLLEVTGRLMKMLDTAALPDLIRQHERTFGHAVQGAAPPYELEYGEEHSHRQPQELSDIAAFYAAFGLMSAASSHERVDHIGTECEFLHYLLYKQACTVDEDATEQAQVCEAASRRFLADHLGRWGPAFALRLTRSAGEGPLAVVGELLLAWLVQECRRQEAPLGSCDLPLRSPKEQDAVGCAACLPALSAVCQPGRQASAPSIERHIAAQAGALPQGRGDGPPTCVAGLRPAQHAGRQANGFAPGEPEHRWGDGASV